MTTDTPTGRARDPLFQQMLCELIANGEYMNKSCAALGMDAVEVYAQRRANEAFGKQLEDAKEVGFDKRAEELQDIAQGLIGQADSQVAIRRAELQIKTRQWHLEKLAPGKYGQKVQVEQKSATVAIPTSDDPVAAQRAYETLLRGSP